MTWQEFALRNPGLAALGQERLNRNGLVMLATLRKNGWPRISPVEPLFFNGQLYLGMMWRSQKALDLLRDPPLLHPQRSLGPSRQRGRSSRSTGAALEITDLGERRDTPRRYAKRSDSSPRSGIPLLRHRYQSAAANTLAGEKFQHQCMEGWLRPLPPPPRPSIPGWPGPGSWRRWRRWPS